MRFTQTRFVDASVFHRGDDRAHCRVRPIGGMTEQQQIRTRVQDLSRNAGISAYGAHLQTIG